jgi:hypothetical protein
MDKGKLYDMIIRDAHQRMDDFLIDVRKNSKSMVDEAFNSPEFTKEPIDTELLKNSTYVTKGTKRGLDKIVVEMKVTTKKATYKTQRKEPTNTYYTALNVIYGLGNHAKYGRRDYQKLVEKEIFNKLKNAFTK